LDAFTAACLIAGTTVQVLERLFIELDEHASVNEEEAYLYHPFARGLYQGAWAARYVACQSKPSLNKESLRLHPAGGIFSRTIITKGDADIGGGKHIPE
jgi:hypothetical protein